MEKAACKETRRLSETLCLSLSPGHGLLGQKNPLGMALPQSLVKFMVTLDIKSVIGGHAAPPSASGSFEKTGAITDLWEGVNSAMVVLLGNPQILNSFPLQLCSWWYRLPPRKCLGLLQVE